MEANPGICLKMLEEFRNASWKDFHVSTPVAGNPSSDRFPRLVWVTEGKLMGSLGVSNSRDNLDVVLRCKDVVYGMPGASTGISTFNREDGVSFAIVFFPEYIRFAVYRIHGTSTPAMFYHHTTAPLGSAGDAVLEALNRIARDPEQRKTSEFLIRAVLELACRVFHLPEQHGKIGKAEATWRKIDLFLTENLSDESVSRRTIASHFRMNPSYLSELCRNQTRHTLNDYLLRKRLSCALLMLEQDYSLGEIAQDCGFSQTGYFIKRFRKVYGITPGKYRLKPIGKMVENS